MSKNKQKKPSAVQNDSSLKAQDTSLNLSSADEATTSDFTKADMATETEAEATNAQESCNEAMLSEESAAETQISAESAESTAQKSATLKEGEYSHFDDEGDADKPLDKNLKLMSPGRMLVRRFFRSKLSVAGLIMLAALFLFCWVGPIFYNTWGETETDRTGQVEIIPDTVETEDGTYIQLTVTQKGINKLADMSSSHPLGTDESGMDILARLMYGGRRSLTISFIAVFLISALGIIMGGIAGYYGGVVDNIIMRICDILMCLPTLPLMLIIGTVLDSLGVSQRYYIYLLMGVLSIFSWPGMARLVRGQILFLREQEYMVAAEAMGFSTSRKIFKHLVPNILPQILVSMTLSLGSMILYESTLSYLNLGVPAPYSSWGTMVEIISRDTDVLRNHLNVWAPPGICIIIAVLGFNFVGDGLRDALDPKQRR